MSRVKKIAAEPLGAEPEELVATEASIRADERAQILALAPEHKLTGQRELEGGHLVVVESTTRAFTNPSPEYLLAFNEGFHDAVARYRLAIEGRGRA